MPPIFCFIDDSPFELKVFEQNITVAAPGLEFLLGSTYEEVRRKLDDRYPCLFLLDLYGRDPDLRPTGVPPREELEEMIQGHKSLQEVYEGLDDFPGDKINEFLKRLFHLVDPWRQLFYYASRATGQNIKYGLSNLAAARRDFPAAAAVAYTRKSIIHDAVEVLSAGVDGLNLKPDGPTDKAIHQATTAAAPWLLETWSNQVTQSFINYLQRLVLLLVKSDCDDEVPRLSSPDRLSSKVREVLGPGEMSFLRTAAEWWSYTGHEPLI